MADLEGFRGIRSKPLNKKKLDSYNTLTWPQNAGNPIYEDLKFQSNPWEDAHCIGFPLAVGISNPFFQNPVSAIVIQTFTNKAIWFLLTIKVDKSKLRSIPHARRRR